MSIKYDEYELLELFFQEPVFVHDKETGMYIYKQDNSDGFTLTMYLSIHEGICKISLCHSTCLNPLFDLRLMNVSCIKGDKEKLVISQNSHQPNVIVYFKPNYALRFAEKED